MFPAVNIAELVIAGVGAAVLAASVAGARHPVIHPAEIRAFQAVNGLPGWLYPVLWLPMQLGNLVVGPAVGLVVAWSLGSWRVAIGVLLATWAKLVVERLVRKQVAQYLTIRQRPGTSQPVATLRGADVPDHGPSFPSGHVILVAAVGTVLTSHLVGTLVWIPFALAIVVALGRVYVGAHNPLDVTAGLGAGLLIGGIIALVF
jgi:membrane-associated phospholipid phosphatase